MNKKASFYFLAVCILLLPRVVRYLYPEIFIEDDFYLQNAFLITAGEKPYADFILNHFPVLELFLALIFKTFGPSIQTAELLTQSFVIINSLLILLIGLRLNNQFTGLVSSGLYACSSVIFRYHVFEREIFTSTCMLMGICLYFYLNDQRRVKYLLIGLIFSVSTLIKFTGALPLIIIIIASLYEKKFKETAIVIVFFSAPLVIATGLYYEQYGYSFYFQVILFHLFTFIPQ